jgi:FkbM family methyltransferase
VELGAFDGVWGSNTKFYEDRLDWRGILIEAHPESFQTLSARRPKSAKFPTAICKEPGAVTMVGKPDAVASADETMAPGFREKWHGGQGEARHRVRCTELHRILAVVGVRKIDFFSLDVEGAELQVLKTMDWTIPVRVWVVENDDHNPTKNAEVDAILAKHGYVKTNLRTCERGTVNCMPNDIYVHPDWETATRSLTHEDLYTNFGTTAC